MTKIKNYTPHEINIIDGEHAGTYPSDGIARIDGLPLGPVVGLPEPQGGTLYVVSVLVAERLPERIDLRVPGQQVRDESGRIVGCRSLSLPSECSPALALMLSPRVSGPKTQEFGGVLYPWGACEDEHVGHVAALDLDGREVCLPAALIIDRHLAECRQGGKGDLRLAAAVMRRACERAGTNYHASLTVLIEAEVDAKEAHRRSKVFAGLTADRMDCEDADWRSSLASLEATMKRTMLVDAVRCGQQAELMYFERLGSTVRWGRLGDKAHHEALARAQFRLVPAPDARLILDKDVAERRFETKDQAWTAAEQLFAGQGADGPFGVQELVSVEEC